MPIIASPEQHPADVRTMQGAAALAVLTLTSCGLPPVCWRIASYKEVLDGYVLEDSDAATRRVVAEYAERLGVTPTEQRSRKDEFTTVAVEGVLDGVPVRVWGHVEEKTDAERVADEVRANAARLETEHAEMDQARELIGQLLAQPTGRTCDLGGCHNRATTVIQACGAVYVCDSCRTQVSGLAARYAAEDRAELAGGVQ